MKPPFSLKTCVITQMNESDQVEKKIVASGIMIRGGKVLAYT